MHSAESGMPYPLGGCTWNHVLEGILGLNLIACAGTGGGQHGGQPRFQKNMPKSLGRHRGHADHRNLICLVGNIIVFHQGESHLTSYDKDSSMYYEESGMSF